MFCQVFRRDPFFSLLGDDFEDEFVTSPRLTLDSYNPLRVLPESMGLLPLLQDAPRRVPKALESRLRKRKCTCECTCEKDKELEEKIEKESNENATSSAKEISLQTSPKKKSRFEVNLKLDPVYKPEEIKVKLSADNRSLIVEGSHQENERSANGFSKVSTQMYQKIPIPKDVDLDQLKCDLNSKGVMMITAPTKLPAIEDKKETVITVNRCSTSPERSVEVKQADTSVKQGQDSNPTQDSESHKTSSIAVESSEN